MKFVGLVRIRLDAANGSGLQGGCLTKLTAEKFIANPAP
jgi:hypothetical protein